jgi:hypothetical protein
VSRFPGFVVPQDHARLTLQEVPTLQYYRYRLKVFSFTNSFFFFIATEAKYRHVATLKPIDIFM